MSWMFVDEAARDPFELAAAQLVDVDGDAPFRAAIGDVDDGRLPGS